MVTTVIGSATGRDVLINKVRKRGAEDHHSFPKKPKLEGTTDPTRWRLKDDDSRHTWHYLQDDGDVEKWPQSHAERYFLNLPMVCPFHALVIPRRTQG